MGKAGDFGFAGFFSFGSLFLEINCRKEKEMIYTTNYHSPIGSFLIAERDNALIGIWMEGQNRVLDSWKEEKMERVDSSVLKHAKEWLDCYFRGEKMEISSLPLAPEGSEFRKAVWKILCEIPYGQVTTYGTIAKRIAAERKLEHMSAQAVGGAVGHNPVSIIIPCHRVIGADGSLTGYAGGIEKKIKLLQLEGLEIKNGMVLYKKSSI